MSYEPFDNLLNTYNEWLDLHEDPGLIRMLVGAVVANDLDGLPVWVILVGAPGSGKSTVLMGLSRAKRIHTISALTPGALMSGYGDSSYSLLPKLNGKVLVIKDLSSVTEMNADARSQVFSLLRDAYDGKLERATGRGELKFEGKFGVMCGGTHAVEAGRKMEGMLGERFLNLRTRISAPDLMTVVTRHAARKKEMAAAIQESAIALLDGFNAQEHFEGLSRETMEYAEHVARALARVRAPVVRDTYTKEVQFPVDVGEVPTRVFEQILMWLGGMQSLGADDNELAGACERILSDNIPHQRSVILRAIAHGAVKEEDIAKKAKMSRTYVHRLLEDMVMLGTVKEDKTSYEILDLVVARAFAPKEEE